MKKLSTVLALLLFVTSSIAYSQSDDWKFSGQIQLRTELDGRDFSNKTYPASFTTMRTRLGVEKQLTSNISAFIQVQDSRIWGETKNTVASIKNVDLHQAYVDFKNIMDVPLNVRAGRFEMQMRNGRIFASNQFSYISRSWDGVKINYDTKPFGIDIFALTHSSHTYWGGASPSQYAYPAAPDEGHNVYGFWSKFAFDKEHYLDVFSYYDNNRKRTPKNNLTSNRFVSGIHYKFSVDNFYSLFEAAYQGGEAGDRTTSMAPMQVKAYTAAVSLNYQFDDLTIGINADVNSGTSEKDLREGKINNTYDASYQVKHSFYGGMDYFNDINKSTGSRGLNDIYLKMVYDQKPFSFILEAHNFTTNKQYRILHGTDRGSLSRKLGNELDIIARVNLLKNTTLEWGGAIFLPDDVMKDIYTVGPIISNPERTDPAFWSYIMLRVGL